MERCSWGQLEVTRSIPQDWHSRGRERSTLGKQKGLGRVSATKYHSEKKRERMNYWTSHKHHTEQKESLSASLLWSSRAGKLSCTDKVRTRGGGGRRGIDGSRAKGNFLGDGVYILQSTIWFVKTHWTVPLRFVYFNVCEVDLNFFKLREKKSKNSVGRSNM